MGFQQIRVELDFRNLMNKNKLKLHKVSPYDKVNNFSSPLLSYPAVIRITGYTILLF